MVAVAPIACPAMDASDEALAIARVRSWLRTGRARQIRERARVSQADLGHAIGSDGPQISRWEAGKAQPRRDYALKLAALLAELEEMTRAEADGSALQSGTS